MNRRFIVAVQHGTPQLRNLITERLKNSGMGYWHWMDSLWLVTRVAPGVTPKGFSEWLEQSPGISDLTYLVLDADSRQYWGRNNPQSWNWLGSEWLRTD